MFSNRQTQGIDCDILTREEVVLSTGTLCAFEADCLTVSGLDRPGRLIKHVLLDGNRELAVRLVSGVLVRVQVERLDHNPGSGRTCTFRTVDVNLD
jgi:hypothetical protein